jgi:diguanylate cyclase (GGDEF)-like protein/PAS domain S-box-containing protein
MLDPIVLKRWLVQWLVFLGALLALAAYAGYAQHDAHGQIERSERDRLTHRADAVEKDVRSQLLLANRIIDGILDDLPSWQVENDGLRRAGHHLRAINNATNGISSIFFTQADGQVLASSDAKLVGMNFLERDGFQEAMENPDHHLLHVSAPFKTALGTDMITLSRDIIGPNGTVAGMVIIDIAPEYFSSLFDYVFYVSGMRTSITDGAGKLFLDFSKETATREANPSSHGSVVTRHSDGSPSDDGVTGASHVIEKESMVVRRTIKLAIMDQPLVATAGRDLDSIFASWRKNLVEQAILLGAIMSLIAAGLWQGQRRQRHRITAILKRQRLAFDKTDVGVIMLHGRKIVKCNQRQADMFGYASADQIEGMTMLLFFRSPKQYQEVGDRLCAVVARDGFVQEEVEMRRQDGSRIWIMLTGRSQGPDEAIDGSLWEYADITLRKQAETELHIAAMAFDAQESIMITDIRGLILRVNRAFTETTGYTAEEAIGQSTRLLQSGCHDAHFYRTIWKTIHRTGRWQGEILDRRKNGDIYPKWLTISEVRNMDDEVTHYIGTHFDISERKTSEEKIHQLAYFDQLTGLPNRTLLLDRLQQAMAANDLSDKHGALLLIDLDHFKTLNDMLGPEMGDMFLQQTGRRLTTCAREGDTVARLGVDEFVLMLANLGDNERDAAAHVEMLAEKILSILRQTCQINDETVDGTASIGISLFGRQSISAKELLKQADLAMYKAKEAGRNRFRFFDVNMASAVKQRAALERDLRQAIDDQQFLLHYQALMADEGRLMGAEVLVRWQHPQRGMVSPAEFIPLAEETGLILPLGNWVLETACLQLATWATRPDMAHLTLAVNVSAHQFRLPDFVDLVLAALHAAGARPERLKLELTESLLMDNVEDVIAKMLILKAQGVGFSLDDFGTGYSSLSYLKRLPLDQLKIDQSFVRDILTDANDAAIAKMVIALAHSLGLGVIAEGVETQAQRDFLASAGCHAYQGFFFSRPLPIEGFEEFARQALKVDGQAAS